MIPHKNPLGYRNLRTWQQANEIFELIEELAATLPAQNPKTGQYLTDLKDQIIRSARSVVRNIEEGYTRNTTKEYISFLGFSAGSLEELIADLKYCQNNRLGDDEINKKAISFCVGEAKMLRAQILSLEKKMFDERTISSNERARVILNNQMRKEKEFDEWIKRVRENIDKGEKWDKDT